jgi:hypothetical protein
LEVLAQPERIPELRAHLASLSWFMARWGPVVGTGRWQRASGRCRQRQSRDIAWSIGQGTPPNLEPHVRRTSRSVEWNADGRGRTSYKDARIPRVSDSLRHSSPAGLAATRTVSADCPAERGPSREGHITTLLCHGLLTVAHVRPQVSRVSRRKVVPGDLRSVTWHGQRPCHNGETVPQRSPQRSWR